MKFSEKIEGLTQQNHNLTTKIERMVNKLQKNSNSIGYTIPHLYIELDC